MDDLNRLLSGLRSSGADLIIEDVLDIFWLAKRIDGAIYDGSEADAPIPLSGPLSPNPIAGGLNGVRRRQDEFARVPQELPSRPVWSDAYASEGTKRASMGSIPGARALSGRLALARSLRPFTLRRRTADRKSVV